MKKATVGMAVLVALGLSTAGFADEQKPHHHHGKGHVAQKHSQVKVADNTASNPNANANANDEANAQNNKQHNAQAANQHQNQQNQAQNQGQSNTNQQSASNANAAGTAGNPDYQEND